MLRSANPFRTAPALDLTTQLCCLTSMKNVGFADARTSSCDDVLPMDVFALMRSDYIILMLERILSLSYIIPQECHNAPHEEEE
jgi:hypothetical protein